MSHLEGKRIVIAGSQNIDKMSDIIVKYGGVPVVRSMQGLSFTDDQKVDEDVRNLIREGTDWAIFTTGIGFNALYNSAERLDMLPEFVETLKKAKVAGRGYRTIFNLKNAGIAPSVIADDGSIRSVANKLEHHDMTGKRVWIQLHGQPHSELIDVMKSQNVSDLQVSLPYYYEPPAEETLKQLVEELREGAVDAVCFTTRAQIGYLFDYVRTAGSLEEIKEAFEHKVLAVAVGKVTADGLREEQIKRIIVPELERMSGMILEIAKYQEISEA
ncbi:uroporphyrinogen-III synthase [Paenibacillus sambharensis]|nr:uroporphyrinogen-III synthase [Paenibacillus sambharensis]